MQAQTTPTPKTKTRAVPLRGIRVIDLGRFISAPYCGMILADLGAEVIRVERPGGEEDRRIGLTAANGENYTYPALGRNKKGITLDVRHPRGREMLMELVHRSDVFLHNFSPGAAVELGITHDQVRQVNSSIIYTGISCYGTLGPYAERPGFDPIAQVMSGAAAMTGLEDDPPLRSGVPWVDYSTGLSAALGTVVALRHRDQAGEGQAVDCALLYTAISYMAPMIAEASIGGRERPRLGNRAPYLGPTDLFRCRDGFVYIACATEGAWRSLMNVIGRPELVHEPELRTQMDRFDHRSLIDPPVAAWIGERTVEEVVRAMDDAHIPCGVYHTPGEVAADPQVQACGLLHLSDLEVPGLRCVPIGAVPIRLSKTPATVVSRAPRIGEHNLEVYEGILGFSHAWVMALQRDRVI